MATFTTVHTARAPHACGTQSHACERRIRPGDRYRRWKATPNDPDIGNTGWISMAECSQCAALYGRPVDGEVAR